MRGPKIVRVWQRLRSYWTPKTAWSLTIAYMGGIFYLSSRPGAEVAAWNTYGIPAFLAHIGLYAGLGVLLHGSLRFSWGGSFARVTAGAVVLATLYGITDEVHQAFVPGRTPSIWDVFYDGVGALLGQLVPGAYELWRRAHAGIATLGGE